MTLQVCPILKPGSKSPNSDHRRSSEKLRSLLFKVQEMDQLNRKYVWIGAFGVNARIQKRT
jgi:hypothetical protein